MKRSTALTLRDTIVQPLRLSELDYDVSIQEVSESPELSNYQVTIHPSKVALRNSADTEYNSVASIPPELATALEEAQPDVTTEVVFGTPVTDITQEVIYWRVNNGVEYEIDSVYERFAEQDWTFTEPMEKLIKSLSHQKMNEELTGPWKYSCTPPQPIVRPQQKPFRAVNNYPSGVTNTETDVFKPSNIIEFIRVPEPVRDSTHLNRGSTASLSPMGNPWVIWSGNVNYICITSGTVRSARSDTSTDPGKNYYLSGGFADPVVTTDTEVITERVYNAAARASTAIKLNTEVEQVWGSISLPDDWQRMSGDEIMSLVDAHNIELTTPRSPIDSLHGVGNKTVAQLARQFGTYHSLAESPTDELNLTNNTHDVDRHRLIKNAEAATALHKLWQEEQKAEPITETEIAELKQYPKDHPNISIHSDEAGRPERTVTF